MTEKTLKWYLDVSEAAFTASMSLGDVSNTRFPSMLAKKILVELVEKHNLKMAFICSFLQKDLKINISYKTVWSWCKRNKTAPMYTVAPLYRLIKENNIETKIFDHLY